MARDQWQHTDVTHQKSQDSDLTHPTEVQIYTGLMSICRSQFCFDHWGEFEFASLIADGHQLCIYRSF